ncbi:early growth response protein 3 [Aspergillus flavus]|nr:early growth response protein 3 [Aspergillus flavus]
MASSLSRGRRRQRKTSQEERICSVCSQSFKKAEHLARHFRSHTEERPFMCQVCGKLYARQDTLLRHARSQHLGTQPHEHPVHGNSAPTSPPISDPVSHLATLERPATDQVCASIDSIIPAPEQVLHELQFSSLDHDSNTATTPSLVHYPQHVDVRAPTTRNILENDNNSNGQWEEDFPSLLPWESFDLDAVNQTLLESMDHGLHNTAPDPIENSLPLDPNLNLANGLTLVQRKWHTFPEPTVPSGDTTPAHSRTNHTVSTHSDDRYRQKLVESLRQKVQPGPLSPSILYPFSYHLPDHPCTHISAVEAKRGPPTVNVHNWQPVSWLTKGIDTWNNEIRTSKKPGLLLFKLFKHL